MANHGEGARGVPNGMIEDLEPRTFLSVTLLAPEFTVAAGSAATVVLSGGTGSDLYHNGEPAVATNARGDAVVAWAADGANGVDVYARRYAAGGVPVGGAFVVNTSLAGDQASPDVALDEAGDFIVSWTSRGAGPIAGVYARQFGGDGQPLGSESLVAAYPTGSRTVLTMPQYTRVAIAPDGHYAIAYDAGDVYLSCFAADGTSLASSKQVSSASAGGGWARLYGVLADGAGNYTVVFDNDDFYLSARRYAGGGAALTGIVDLRDPTTPYGFAGTPAMDAAGNFVVPWGGYDNVVRARRYNADLTGAGAAFTVDTWAGAPAAALDPAGNLTISYTTLASLAAPASVVRLKTYPASGAATSTFRVASPGGADRGTSEVAATGDGSVFVIDTDSLDPRAVYGRWYQGYANPASLGDRVWRDSNANGVQDAFEAGVANATVTLFDESGLEIAQSVTSSTGQYAFPEVMPGQRVYVAVTPPAAYFATERGAGADGSLDSDMDPATWRTDVMTLGAGEARADVDMGLIPASTVVGTVFQDLDRDGVRDTNEPALSGWTVYVDANNDGQLGPGEPSAQTSSTGFFLMQNLRPGSVAIRVVPQPQWDAPAAKVLALQPGQSVSVPWGLTTGVFAGVPRESGTWVSLAPSATAGVPDVAVDGQKRIIVVWGAGGNIYFQRLASDAAHTPLAPAAVIQTGANVRNVQLAAWASGDFIVSWQTDDPRGTLYAPITYLRRFDSEGRPTRDVAKVTPWYLTFTMATLPDGGYLLARGNQSVITVERYGADGAMIGTPMVASQTATSAGHASVAVDAAGAFVVAWDAPDVRPVSANDRDVYARLFAADGTPLTDEMRLNSRAAGYQNRPVAAAAGDGHFVVAWMGDNAEAPSSNMIQFQRFDRSGRVGGEIVGGVADVNVDPDVAVSASGEIAVAYQWSEHRVLYYTAAGVPSGPTINLSRNGSYKVSKPVLVMDGDGDFVGAWQELGPRGVVLRRFVAPPAAVVAAADPNAAPGQARVRFSEPLSVAPTGAAVRVQNLTTGRVLDPSEYAWDYDPAARVVTFKLLGTGTEAVDGNYRLTLPAAAMTDVAGNAMTSDFTFDFFVLSGDANRDRVVNFADLLTLAKNYNGTNKTWAEGDFTGDGVVNFADLLVLAKAYNKALAAPAPVPVEAVAPAMAAVTTNAVLADGDAKAKPVFSTTPVAKPAPKPVPVKAKAGARAKGR